jgi:hypothetical protein
MGIVYRRDGKTDSGEEPRRDTGLRHAGNQAYTLKILPVMTIISL